VFNLRGDYLQLAQDYDKVLRQRNTVLRTAADGGLVATRVDELLGVYDTQLARLGREVADGRAHFVTELAPDLMAAFAAISRTEHRATARYVSTWAGRAAEDLEAQLKASRSRDLAAQTTTLGPHRDDLAFELDGRDAGGFASQGQLRAIMLAWKSAELAVLTKAHGEPPILLLDDVSSELDPARNAYLFEHLACAAGQCFITTTHEGHVLLTGDRADYRIRNGQISS
jgi:DNA replication and repair protein RecF